MIAILAALKEEIKPIIKEMEISERVSLRPAVIFNGSYKGHEIIICHTGIGADKMRHAAEFCIKEYSPEKCINIGYCGALTPNLALGDLVVSTFVVHEKEGIPYQIAQSEVEAAKEKILACGLKFHAGTSVTVDRGIANPHEKAFYGTKFDAISVDMESTGLAAAASASGCPFLIVRSVLDPLDMHLPEFPASVSDDGTTNILGLIADVVKHPKEALNLPNLQFCASKARETSLRFLDEFLS